MPSSSNSPSRPYDLYGHASPSDGLIIIFPGFGCPASYFEAIGKKLSEKTGVCVAGVTFSLFDSTEPEGANHVPLSQHGREAVAVFDQMMSELKPNSKRLAVVGHCYGAAMAAHLIGSRRVPNLALIAPITFPDFAWHTPFAQFPKQGEPGPFFQWRSTTYTPRDNRLLRNLANYTGNVRIIQPALDYYVARITTATFYETPKCAVSVDGEVLPASTHGKPEVPNETIVRRWENSIVDSLDRQIGPLIGARGHLVPTNEAIAVRSPSALLR